MTMLEKRVELTIETRDQDAANRRIVLSPGRWQPGDTACQLHEDGRYSLVLRWPEEFGHPLLELQGYQLDEPHRILHLDEGITLWKWEPDQTVFRNCFGLTTFRIQSGDQVIEFPPVEVLARKLKADEARGMLEYLWGRNPELLYACFARTGFAGDVGETPPSVERILKQADATLQPVEKLVFSSHNRARKRLVETVEVKPLTLGDVIDDRAVHFALQHLDYATDAPSSNSVAFPVGHRWLHFDQLAVVRKLESTNVYENGVIHGVLHSIERRLLVVQRRLEAILDEINQRMQETRSQGPDEGYLHFRVVCGYYVHQVAQRPLDQVADMLRRVRRCQRRAHAVIPATPLFSRPRLTPTFSIQPPYRPIFRQTIAWYRLGDGLTAASDLILGLKTIDRLYEYVCLFKIIETLKGEGWELKETRTISSAANALRDNILDYYRLEHIRYGPAEVLYEPQIPPFGSGSNLWGLVKVAGSRNDAFRPDFMIRFGDGQRREPVMVVMDAKYSTREVMRERHLPGVVLKYLHGVCREADPSRPPFDHCWLLGPIADNLVHYHNLGRGIVNVRPTIGMVRVLSGADQDGLKSWYRQIAVPHLQVRHEPHIET